MVCPQKKKMDLCPFLLRIWPMEIERCENLADSRKDRSLGKLRFVLNQPRARIAPPPIVEYCLVISRNQAGAVAECRLAMQFESISNTLLHSAVEGHLDTLLADWVIPTDRRLPLVFLQWTLRKLLSTPFEQLYCVSGVGQKRFESLLQLLHRVAESSSLNAPSGPSTMPCQAVSPGAATQVEFSQVDCSQVSETVWLLWRQRIVEHGLEGETLGRFAASLQQLPRVLWRTPLADYTHLTLAEIRSLKTHGEKRIQAVLEVFRSLQGALGTCGSQPHLVIQCRPRLISRLEDWLRAVLTRDGKLTNDEVRHSYVEPLVQQIEIDGGELLADLARRRLGLDGAVESVIAAAHRMGFMRSRVYQLLDEIATMIAVRWPEGATLTRRLCAALANEGGAAYWARFEAACDLFFPELRSGGPPSVTSRGALPTANDASPTRIQVNS